VSAPSATSAPERIGYEFADTSVGRLLVAFSDDGLVWLSFADSDAEALDALSHRFPRAVVSPDEGTHQRWVADAVASVESPATRALRAPLDLRGTTFQRAVWDALLDIPAGQTRSYGDVARAIGRPTAVRAVAQACGANPVALLVPCHRVIGSDGSLTGYASGLERKHQLLEHERPDG